MFMEKNNYQTLLENKIQEVLDKLKKDNITSTPLLRKLSFKSKIGFGKYTDLTVQEIIDMERSSYLRAIYYNMEGISFTDDVLKKLRIITDKYDYTIPKPGKNPEYGEEVFNKLFNSLNFKIKSHLGKRLRGDVLKQTINNHKYDEKTYSKGNLTRINQGHGHFPNNTINEETNQTPYMVISNLQQLKKDIDTILQHKDHPYFTDLVTGNHAWAGDHITTSKDDIEEVANFIQNFCNNQQDINENIIYEDEYGSVEKTNFISNDILNEAEYKGRKVKLNKIMQGDIKKFKVYVKNDKGNIVKVNFGFGGKSANGKRMVIKKNNPERRKSFRARHHCENPGPKWKPRYWACKTW